MSNYKFKTNIKCSGCQKKVSTFLQGEPKITKWDVDINNPDKILTVETDGLTDQQVKDLITKAGYSAQSI